MEEPAVFNSKHFGMVLSCMYHYCQVMPQLKELAPDVTYPIQVAIPTPSCSLVVSKLMEDVLAARGDQPTRPEDFISLVRKVIEKGRETINTPYTPREGVDHLMGLLDVTNLVETLVLFTHYSQAMRQLHYERAKAVEGSQVKIRIKMSAQKVVERIMHEVCENPDEMPPSVVPTFVDRVLDWCFTHITVTD